MPTGSSRTKCPKKVPSFRLEREHWGEGRLRILGVDEVGRGCLAGPVTVGGVVFAPGTREKDLKGVRDSKTLSHAQREALFERIVEKAEVYATAEASAAEIDQLNIRGALVLAIRRLVEAVGPVDHILIDGSVMKELSDLPCSFVVKGDASVMSISAAAIVAKVTRDRLMTELAASFPAYGWERNAGYGSAEHRAAIEAHGLTPHHRRSFGNRDQLALDL